MASPPILSTEFSVTEVSVLLARRVGVQVDVARDRRHPAIAAFPRGQAEAADHPLAALVVAVQQPDGDVVGLLDRPPDGLELLAGGIAERSLPEPDVARGNIEVAREAVERLHPGRLNVRSR